MNLRGESCKCFSSRSLHPQAGNQHGIFVLLLLTFSLISFVIRIPNAFNSI